MPVVKALLLCDYVVLDRDSGKNSFIGVFHRITVRRLPTHHPPLWIVAEVTELEGRHDFEFLLVNNNGQEGPAPVARGEIRGVPFKDRHEIYTIRFQTGPVPLPNAGRYDVQFSCDGTLVESQSFEVRQIQRVDGQPAADAGAMPPGSGDASPTFGMPGGSLDMGVLPGLPPTSEPPPSSEPNPNSPSSDSPNSDSPNSDAPKPDAPKPDAPKPDDPPSPKPPPPRDGPTEGGRDPGADDKTT